MSKKQFTIDVDIEKNIRLLLDAEDTDKDKKITVDDKGHKRFLLTGTDGRSVIIEGTYFLSNLLQELTLASESGKKTTAINSEHIYETPVNRISRMIRNYYWGGLTRRIDAGGIIKILSDSKTDSNNKIIYVPYNDSNAFEYYTALINEHPELGIKVKRLPKVITPEYILSINDEPGILSLNLRRDEFGNLRGVPFVVPGGRFNEMYGWDSYFEALGLIADGRNDLARAMVDNFIYELRYYGKILNANRSYYLTRSQPPFLTSLIYAVYKSLSQSKENKEWLAESLRWAIFEYDNVWMNKDRLTATGLSRYFGSGVGLPPETEPDHFNSILKPYAVNYGLSLKEFRIKYLKRKIIIPELDEYFIHDRSVRESGHDTSNRLNGICAHLNTIDLNSLLYKFETDIASIIHDELGDKFINNSGGIETSDKWYGKAEKRKELVSKLLWNDHAGFFFDYDFKNLRQTMFESATAFYPLWAKLASQQQARALIKKALPQLEQSGGVSGSSLQSRGKVSSERPQRQWDYPYGWAPHQILIWQGLVNYGFNDIAERLAYRWLYTITKNAVDYNGTIPEKYDVVNRSHKVFAEYGNVGTEFDYITREGFGWMNASFQIGLKYLSLKNRNYLDQLIPPEKIFTDRDSELN